MHAMTLQHNLLAGINGQAVRFELGQHFTHPLGIKLETRTLRTSAPVDSTEADAMRSNTATG